DEREAAHMATANAAWETELLQWLTDAIAASPISFAIVLDDVHVLEGPSRDIVLASVATHIPIGSMCVLASRMDPPIPLTRLQLTGRASTIATEDLALTSDEGIALLDGAGVALDDEHARDLVDRTEGWAAGLYIAALSLRHVEDVAAAAEQFTGSHRLVADF